MPNAQVQLADLYAAVHESYPDGHRYAVDNMWTHAPVDELLSLVQTAGRLRTAGLAGLMILPPASDDPEHARPYFRALRQLRDDLISRGVDAALLGELSMGMTQDLDAAVTEGSTLVRIGTALYGPRE